MDDSKKVNRKYSEYLRQIRALDMADVQKILGLQRRKGAFVFEFFNRHIAFDGKDFTDISGAPVTHAVKIVLCQYVLMCPARMVESSNRLVTFREFTGAGPLFSSFAANTGKIIETTFSGQVEPLKTRCLKLGGTLVESDGYDLSVRFRALHRIPIIFNFNDKEDAMPATAGFLYHDTAEQYLDLECLTLTATYLTGMMIQGT